MRLSPAVSDKGIAIQYISEKSEFYMDCCNPTKPLYEDEYNILSDEDKKKYIKYELKDHSYSTDWLPEITTIKEKHQNDSGFIMIAWNMPDTRKATVQWVPIPTEQLRSVRTILLHYIGIY